MKTQLWSYFFVIAFCSVTILFFQNCADDFSPDQYADLSSSDNEPEYVPDPVDVTAPVILQEIQNATVTSGQDAVFQVTVGGSNPVYQWYKDNTLIPANNTNVLLLSSVTAANAGTYKVVITNSLGSAESTATLTVQTPAPPPANEPPPVAPLTVSTPEYIFAVVPRNNATILATTSGGVPPYTYTWYKGTRVIVGATTNRLVFSPVKTTDSGAYRVVVRDSEGRTAEAISTVDVEYRPPGGGPIP